MASNPEPSYPPTLADWEDLRPIIVKLYVGEHKNLSEVQRLLVENYGFRASYAHADLSRFVPPADLDQTQDIQNETEGLGCAQEQQRSHSTSIRLDEQCLGKKKSPIYYPGWIAGPLG